MVDEGESGTKLFGGDQEARAVSLPFLFHVALPRVTVLLSETVDCDLETGSLARARSIIFCESESDCTSEMGAGQFSIFGAVEEKRRSRFSRIGTDEATGEGRVIPQQDRGSFQVGGVAGRIWQSTPPGCPQGVHRKYRK